VLEVEPGAEELLEHVLLRYRAFAMRIGETIGDHVLVLRHGGEEMLRLSAADMRRAWTETIEKAVS